MCPDAAIWSRVAAISASQQQREGTLSLLGLGMGYALCHDIYAPFGKVSTWIANVRDVAPKYGSTT